MKVIDIDSKTASEKTNNVSNQNFSNKMIELSNSINEAGNTMSPQEMSYLFFNLAMLGIGVLYFAIQHSLAKMQSISPVANKINYKISYTQANKKQILSLSALYASIDIYRKIITDYASTVLYTLQIQEPTFASLNTIKNTHYNANNIGYSHIHFTPFTWSIWSISRFSHQNMINTNFYTKFFIAHPSRFSSPFVRYGFMGSIEKSSLSKIMSNLVEMKLKPMDSELLAIQDAVRCNKEFSFKANSHALESG